MVELYREPEDYSEESGTKYQRGDIVVTTGTSFTGVKTGSIGIVIYQPNALTEENADRWENIYNIQFVDNEYVYHSHVHESDIKLCDSVNDGFLIEYSKFLKKHSREESYSSQYRMELSQFLHNHNKKSEGE